MPIYEYRCDDCEHVTELLRTMNQADDKARCESCGSGKTRRVQSVFAATVAGAASKECPATGQGCCKCVNDGACGLN